MSKKKPNNILKIIISAIICIAVSVIALILILNNTKNDQEQVVTYEKIENGVTTSMTYYAKGDNVYKQTTKNTVPYSIINAEDASEAREILDPLLKEAINNALEIDGYEDTIEYGENSAIEYVSVDFDVIDKSKLKDLIGGYFVGDTEKGWSLSKSIQWLEDSGFTKVNN